MNSSFFPEPGPIPEPEQHVVPPWSQLPGGEYPVRVLVREFLAHIDGTPLSVSPVDVSSTWVRIKLDWEFRRRDESVTDWQMAVDMFHTHQSFLEQPVGWPLMDQAPATSWTD